jgi:hypothetical protein
MCLRLGSDQSVDEFTPSALLLIASIPFLKFLRSGSGVVVAQVEVDSREGYEERACDVSDQGRQQ